jgi:hypothetical protein
MIIEKGKMLFADGPYGFHWEDKVGFARGNGSASFELPEVNQEPIVLDSFL